MHEAFAARFDGAETALLAAAIFGTNPPTVLAAVEAEEFSSTATRSFWGRCRDILRDRGSLGVLDVTTDAWIDQPTLRAVLALQSAALDPGRCVEEFRCANTLRRAVAACERTSGHLRETAFEARAIADALGQIASALQGLSTGLQIRTIDRELPGAWESYVASLHGTEAAWVLSTGILDLDARIGDLRPGTFTVVVGRSGHGKSSLALTASLHAARSRARVYYLSREMLRQELASRFAAAALEEPLNRLRERITRGDPEFEDAAWQAVQLPITIEDEQMHIDSIRAQVQRERLAGHPFRLVVLDFLQVLVAEGKEQHERLERLAYSAKDMAMQEGCAVIGLAQPNRVGSKAEDMPTMHDIRGSSAIENAADSVIAVRRQDTRLSGQPFPFLMKVEKARNGRPGGLGGDYELGAGTFLVRQVRSENANAEAI